MLSLFYSYRRKRFIIVWKEEYAMGNFGQIVLSIAIIMIMIAALSLWFDWFEQCITAAIFVIAVILAGAGSYASKRRKKIRRVERGRK